MPNPFQASGSWLRGNLHTHTTNSDGPLGPQETVDTYAALGYDFLALTDHDRFTVPDDLHQHDLTLLPAVELARAGDGPSVHVHVMALGIEEVPQTDAEATWEAAIADYAAQAEVCFIAHPFWSLLEGSRLLSLEGVAGLEVYNRTCEGQSGRGTSESEWDELLRQDRPCWGFAVDDCHQLLDHGYGWISVRSEERSVEALLAAVECGSFYASTGPELRDLRLTDDGVRVESSPCVQAALLGARPGAGRTTWYREDLTRPFEEVTLPIPTREAWLRVEVIDERGRKAWSNPFRLEELEAQ